MFHNKILPLLVQKAGLFQDLSPKKLQPYVERLKFLEEKVYWVKIHYFQKL